MKTNFIKSAAVILAVVALPVLVQADTLSVSGGGTGADSSTGTSGNTNLTVSGGGTGADSSTGASGDSSLSVSGGGTGADSSTGASGNTSLTVSGGGTGADSSTGASGGSTLIVSGGGTGADSGSSSSGPSTPSTPAAGGGSSSSSSGGSPMILSVTASDGATTSCPLITDYMKLGWKNDPVQVAKLQSFLKNNEGIDVEVTGTYDDQTVEAVKAFQAKYKDTILDAWNAAGPTGEVYITTAKQINLLACAQPLTLTADELGIIQAYKQSIATDNVATVALGAPTVTLVDATTTASTTADQTANTAAAGNASIFWRLWNFIRNLF